MSTVLMTGCSVGIGFETALAFARAGHSRCRHLCLREIGAAFARALASRGLNLIASRASVSCCGS